MCARGLIGKEDSLLSVYEKADRLNVEYDAQTILRFSERLLRELRRCRSIVLVAEEVELVQGAPPPPSTMWRGATRSEAQKVTAQVAGRGRAQHLLAISVVYSEVPPDWVRCGQSCKAPAR
jgi:hypothetical protein